MHLGESRRAGEAPNRLEWLDPPDDTPDIPDTTPRDPDPPPTGWWETIQAPPLRDDELHAITRATDARFFTDQPDEPDGDNGYHALQAAWQRTAEEHYDRILRQDPRARLLATLGAP